MRRHPIDLLSLVAGLLFTALAVGYIASNYYEVDINPRLVLPVTFVLLGLAGLAGSVLAQRRSDRELTSTRPESS